MFKPTPLPWPANSLPEFHTEKSILDHYNGHYMECINRLNSDPKLRGQTLEYIMSSDIGLMPDYAREVWNHNLFWKLLTPNPKPISGPILDFIIRQFRSFDNFKKLFEETVVNQFSNGWVWLSYDVPMNSLAIVDGQNSFNPLQNGNYPLLCLDVWEHAYVIDYNDNRLAYVQNFWKYVDWDAVNWLIEHSITVSASSQGRLSNDSRT